MKKRSKKKRLIVFTLLICILSLIILINNSFKISTKKNTSKIPSQEDIWPKEYKLSFLATGDGLIHSLVANYAKNSDGTYNFKQYLTEVKDIVSSKDISYYNQETVFGGKELGYSYYPSFNTPSEFGDAMIDAGFNTISLATNHSLDKGEQGILNSLKYWKSKDNILYTGMASSKEERDNFAIMEKNNIKYGLLSYTYGTNGRNVPKGKNYLINIYNDDIAKKDITAIRDKVDVLIVAMHWGKEYAFEPTDLQKKQANYLASLGVDIIIGNHPHCIEPIKWIDNTLVIYSLGNFISNQIELYNRIGYKGAVGAFAMLDIIKTVNKDQTSNIKLDNLQIELLYTYRNKNKKTYKVIPFSKINEKYLPNYKNVYEDYKNVIQKYDQNIYVIPAA